MEFEKFNKLADNLQQEGRKKEATQQIMNDISSKYAERYAQSSRRSEEIVNELIAEYPDYNVPEILRQGMDFNRE